MTHHLQVIHNKIADRQRAVEETHAWRVKGERIVFTNGCFDLLHRGHVEYLAEAASLGDRLVIGLNTDRSVRSQQKGVNRPVNAEADRALLLAALGFVDLVVLFDEVTPAGLIESLSPDFLVKGSDYNPEEIAGYEHVIRSGGKVTTIPLIPGYSTSSLIARITGDGKN